MFLDQAEAQIRRRSLDQNCRCAEQKLGHRENMHLGGMIERQRREREIVPRELQLHHAGHVLGHEGPVGHHGAFGGCRRSGRIEELNEVRLVGIEVLNGVT